jgi:hypothetical protein
MHRGEKTRRNKKRKMAKREKRKMWNVRRTYIY